MGEENHGKSKIKYMAHDWPEHMHMSNEAFEDYAAKLEKDDFEDDVRGLNATLVQLCVAREDTISKLRASADYLDSIWFRCKVSRTVGTSTSVVGGSLTIAGGILTLTTAGAAAPLLIAGIATSSVGAATNIGTSLIERIINSKQVKEMTGALTVDRELTLKIESQIDDLRRYKDSVHLGALISAMEMMLGSNHIVVAILHSLFLFDTSGILGISAKFFSEGVQNAIKSMNDSKSLVAAVVTKSQSDSALLSTASTSAAAACTAALAASSASGSSTALACKDSCKTVAKQASKDIKYNPFGPDIFVETGKVVGQNSTRLAGKVIVGVSAAFLVWDVIDLGFTVSDLVQKKGSKAGEVLRQKADQLESALKETKAQYNLDMMPD
eukprot:10927.XXX_217785_219014_1 [CDS] Oithona nana genome sequencing.